MTSFIQIKIDEYIIAMEKLKHFEKKFKNENNFMIMTNILNYERSVEYVFQGVEKKLEKLKNKCQNMNRVLNRENVVITIFGSVSVGKSCFLNALLHDKIFRSAAAHTTSCFATVEKGNYNCLKYRNKEVKYDNFSDMSKKINELTSNLRKNENTLNNDEVLSVFIKDLSKTILRNGVVIMDTPGADKNRDIHDIVKKQSENSDIFIFILNCNITDVDKSFFRYQTETSVRPDIFILINKWDQYDDEDTENSKLNIKKDCLKFIRRQKGGNEEDIESQIHFISTREVLNKRTNLQNNSNLTPKQRQRYDEFVKFERKLQEYINYPKKNKRRRYKCDIKEVKEEIERIRYEFKNNFTQWMNYLEDVRTFLKNVICDIENLKKKPVTITEVVVTIGNLDRTKSVEEMQKQLESIYNSTLTKLNDMNVKCEQEVTKCIENIGKYNRNLNIGTESIKREIAVLRKNVNLTKPRPPLNKLVNSSSGVGASVAAGAVVIGTAAGGAAMVAGAATAVAASAVFLPVVGIIGAVSAIEYLWNRSKINEAIEENKKELESALKSFKANMNSQREDIKQYYINLSDKMHSKFVNDEKCLENYKDKLYKCVFDLI